MIYKNLFKFKHLTLESEILFRYNFIILIDSVISGIVTFLFSGAVSCFPIQSFCPPKRRAKRISTSIRAKKGAYLKSRFGLNTSFRSKICWLRLRHGHANNADFCSGDFQQSTRAGFKCGTGCNDIINKKKMFAVIVFGKGNVKSIFDPFGSA